MTLSSFSKHIPQYSFTRYSPILFFGVLIPLLLFGWLATNVLLKTDLSHQNQILLAIHTLASPLLDTIMVAITQLGYPYGSTVIFLVILGWLVWRKRWTDGSFLTLAVIGSGVLNIIVKHFFQRVRPHLWVSPAPEFDFGFPSGHAMFTMALAIALIVLAWPTRWRWPVAIISSVCVLLVGFSRLYLGVHYPSDVVAAWLASIAWVVGLSYLVFGNLVKPTPHATAQQVDK